MVTAHIVAYNKYMNVVDVADQLHRVTVTARKEGRIFMYFYTFVSAQRRENMKT